MVPVLPIPPRQWMAAILPCDSHVFKTWKILDRKGLCLCARRSLALAYWELVVGTGDDEREEHGESESEGEGGHFRSGMGKRKYWSVWTSEGERPQLAARTGSNSEYAISSPDSVRSIKLHAGKCQLSFVPRRILDLRHTFLHQLQVKHPISDEVYLEPKDIRMQREMVLPSTSSELVCEACSHVLGYVETLEGEVPLEPTWMPALTADEEVGLAGPTPERWGEQNYYRYLC